MIKGRIASVFGQANVRTSQPTRLYKVLGFILCLVVVLLYFFWLQVVLLYECNVLIVFFITKLKKIDSKFQIRFVHLYVNLVSKCKFTYSASFILYI